MSNRQRDLKFEVQYLLSLTLVVFGLLTVPLIRQVIDVRAAYPVIFFLACHLSVFTIVYGVGQTGLTVELVESIRGLNWPILSLIGASFVFFVLHSALGVAYYHLSSVFTPLPLNWEIVIKYVVPLPIIGIMGYSVKRHGYDPLSSFDGINIKVVPEFIRVFPEAGSSKPLMIKVENNGDKTFDYELFVDIPDVVTLHKDGEVITETFSDDEDVAPGRANRYSFDLSHIAEEHSAEEISIEIRSDGASFTADIELELAI